MKLVVLPGGDEATAGAAGVAQDPADAHGFAIGGDDGRWLLVDVSAEGAGQLLRHRLGLAAELLAARAMRLLLTDARPRHIAGLQALLAAGPVELFATPAVFEVFTEQLPQQCAASLGSEVHWHLLPLAGDRVIAAFAVAGLPALEFTVLAVAGRSPQGRDGRPPQVGDMLAAAVRDRRSGQQLFCTSSASRLGSVELEWMSRADCLLIDGRLALDAPTEADWLGQIARLPARHKLLLAPEGRCPGVRLADFGIERATQGMEIAL